MPRTRETARAKARGNGEGNRQETVETDGQTKRKWLESAESDEMSRWAVVGARGKTSDGCERRAQEDGTRVPSRVLTRTVVVTIT